MMRLPYGIVLVCLALVATACGGSSATAGVSGPQRTTLFEAFVAESPTGEEATTDWIGDPLAPGLGNGGYNVERYEISTEWFPQERQFQTTVLITAQPFKDLREINLDFVGSIIRSVTVDGLAADHARDDAELVIIPSGALATGEPFEIEIEYLTDPEMASGRSVLANGTVGWIATSDEVWYTRNAPDGMHYWLPSNNHPSDRARFVTEITVPDGWAAVASGKLGSEQRGIEKTTTRWATTGEIPPHAMTLAVGPFAVVEDTRGSAASGIQLRHFLPPKMADKIPAVLHRADDMILFLEQRFGRFPDDAWGVVVVADGAPSKAGNGWTIMTESQINADDAELRMMRDLATHYFGHSVGIDGWSDVWLSEAIPTYMQWLWLQGSVGRAGLDVTIAAARAKVNNAAWPAPDEPRSGNVYVGSGPLRGALFLHALSLKIGTSEFFDVLAQAHDQYQGQALSTAQFIALSKDVSGVSIASFADAWFHRDPLPGFPDG